jgi:hypothetical protein
MPYAAIRTNQRWVWRTRKELITHLSKLYLLYIEDKIDFWFLTSESFDILRFKRHYPKDFFGIKMFVTSPESKPVLHL